eukprot:Gb_39136 [translate_table: standard]
MDAYEATRIVFSRIQGLEPENVYKIMGYILLQDHGDQEMIRLAFGPDTLLQSLISKAKKDLALLPQSLSSSSFLSPSNANLPLQISQFNSNNSPSRPAFPSPPAISLHHAPYWGTSHPQPERPLSALSLSLSAHDQLRQANLEEQNYLNYSSNSLQVSANDKLQSPLISFEKLPTYHHEQLNVRDDYQLRDQLSFLNDSSISQNMFTGTDYLYPDMLGYLNGTKLSMDQLHSIPSVNGDQHRPSSIPDVSETAALAWKPCLYFARGYCKHGTNCRFLHGYARQENAVPLSLSSSPTESRSNEDVFQSGSLERLELELQELLRGKRAPVSIASLPQLYYERFGKTLQAEGYLTESQRHGKAGYSLTKLLARLKNTVTLIDRPHGQHAVVLAEDAHKFAAYRSERDDLGGVNPGSRQIYLTFPAESTFTEEDVSNHFRTYGPVQDVRIPYQQKRMFGFVTFVYPDTVKIILNKGNPHYVCGARVLVKPYREKGKVAERKYSERGEHSRYVPANNFDTREYDMHFAPRLFDSSEVIRRHIEEQEQAIELERRRLAELHLVDAQRVRLAESQVSVAASTALVSHALQNQLITNGLLHSEEESKAVEDLNNFPCTDHFGYLLEVLDNNEEDPKHDNNEDQESYGHILPESPFASPIVSNGNKALSNPEKTKNLPPSSLNSVPKTIAAPATSTSDLNKELAPCASMPLWTQSN